MQRTIWMAKFPMTLEDLSFRFHTNTQPKILFFLNLHFLKYIYIITFIHILKDKIIIKLIIRLFLFIIMQIISLMATFYIPANDRIYVNSG